MKTVVKAIDLSNAVAKVVKAVSTKGQNPVLECIKLSCKGDALSLSATDTEIAIEDTIKADTFMEGETLVPGKLFADFINKLEEEDDLELFIDGEMLKITYSSSEGFIQTFNPEDFPVIEKNYDKNSFTLSQRDFKEIIAKTNFACLQDDSRPILKGCLLEINEDVLTCVALDGFRLAVCKKTVKESRGKIKAIVPSRALNEITRLLSRDEDMLTMIIQDKTVMAEVDGTIFTARLLEGEYIDYRQIIPTSFVTVFKANRIILENAIERAAVVAKVMKNIIKLDIKENSVNITANSEKGNVNENVLINLEGKDLTIAFNSKYILDCLHAINEDFINVSLNSPIAPCIIKPEGNDDSMYLVLPIRINS